MLTMSVIVPSFNQERYIRETLLNLEALKTKTPSFGVQLQIILVDNCSDTPTQKQIKAFSHIIDNLIVEPDKGQYDAINKGLKLVAGDYWTWLNTDDLIDQDGFAALAAVLKQKPDTDYIYGDVIYIDESSAHHKNSSSGEISLEKLLYSDASISQPGSFFRTSFTRALGNLEPYQFAFDYEFILRCLKNKAKVVKLPHTVAHFRYYNTSKSGSRDFRFLKEQLVINKKYGGNFFSRLGFMLRLRIMKRKLVN